MSRFEILNSWAEDRLVTKPAKFARVNLSFCDCKLTSTLHKGPTDLLVAAGHAVRWQLAVTVIVGGAVAVQAAVARVVVAAHVLVLANTKKYMLIYANLSK